SYSYSSTGAVELAEGMPYRQLVGQAVITLFADKPWYTGADDNVPADQYDYQSAVTHELGHAVGLPGNDEVFSGLNSDGRSAMAESLALGAAHRRLSPSDLAALGVLYSDLIDEPVDFDVPSNDAVLRELVQPDAALAPADPSPGATANETGLTPQE